MTTPTSSLLLSLSTVLLLASCASPKVAAPAGGLSHSSAVVATPPSTEDAVVTIQNYGDPMVATKRLINRPLTNKDIGKVYELISYNTPLGTKSEERVIVRTSPKLQTKVVSR